MYYPICCYISILRISEPLSTLEYEWIEIVEEETLYEKMAAKLPDQYCDKRTSMEQGTGCNSNRIALNFIFFQSNLYEDKKKFGENEIEWFEKVSVVMYSGFDEVMEMKKIWTIFI